MTYLGRYIINGVAATALHFAVLSLNLNVLEIPSAGLANLIASVFGITASFLGSRYFVFRRIEESILVQGLKFSVLYGMIALLHGAVLLVLTDWMRIDYRIGFLMATVLQIMLSYFGNKVLVFRV